MLNKKLPIYPLHKDSDIGYRIRPSLRNPYTHRSEQKDFQDSNWTYEDAKYELEKIKKRPDLYFKPIDEETEAKQNIGKVLISKSIAKQNSIQSMTLNELYELWRQYASEHKYKESTIQGKEYSYNNYIREKLGFEKLKDISQAMVTDWSNKLEIIEIEERDKTGKLIKKLIEKKLSDNTKSLIVDVMNNIIKYASEYQGIDLKLEAPRFKKDKNARVPITLSNDQLAEFLNIIKADNYLYFAFFSFLAQTGVRKGEARGLLCDKIDFVNKRVLIDKNLVRCKKGKEKNSKSYTVGPTKGNDSTYLPLTDYELIPIRKLIDEYEKEDDYNPKEYFVFGGLEPLSESDLARRLAKYKAKLEVLCPEIDSNFTFHDIRHSTATDITNNYGINEARMQLRHKDPKTTAGYVHTDINREINEKRAKSLHKH